MKPVPTRGFTVLLFLSSYNPFFLLLAVRSYHRSCVIFTSALVLFVVSLAALEVFLWAAKRKASYETRIISIENRDADVAAYAATYLLPFLTIFSGSWQDILSVALFLVFIAVIYVNSKMVYANPLLALHGYHLLLARATTSPEAVSVDTLQPQFILTRSRYLRSEDRITVVDVTPDVLIGLATRK
jgi:hypothetical protein